MDIAVLLTILEVVAKGAELMERLAKAQGLQNGELEAYIEHRKDVRKAIVQATVHAKLNKDSNPAPAKTPPAPPSKAPPSAPTA